MHSFEHVILITAGTIIRTAFLKKQRIQQSWIEIETEDDVKLLIIFSPVRNYQPTNVPSLSLWLWHLSVELEPHRWTPHTDQWSNSEPRQKNVATYRMLHKQFSPSLLIKVYDYSTYDSLPALLRIAFNVSLGFTNVPSLLQLTNQREYCMYPWLASATVIDSGKRVSISPPTEQAQFCSLGLLVSDDCGIIGIQTCNIQPIGDCINFVRSPAVCVGFLQISLLWVLLLVFPETL